MIGHKHRSENLKKFHTKKTNNKRQIKKKPKTVMFK